MNKKNIRLILYLLGVFFYFLVLIGVYNLVFLSKQVSFTILIFLMLNAVILTTIAKHMENSFKAISKIFFNISILFLTFSILIFLFPSSQELVTNIEDSIDYVYVLNLENIYLQNINYSSMPSSFKIDNNIYNTSILNLSNSQINLVWDDLNFPYNLSVESKKVYLIIMINSFNSTFNLTQDFLDLDSVFINDLSYDLFSNNLSSNFEEFNRLKSDCNQSISTYCENIKLLSLESIISSLNIENLKSIKDLEFYLNNFNKKGNYYFFLFIITFLISISLAFINYKFSKSKFSIINYSYFINYSLIYFLIYFLIIFFTYLIFKSTIFSSFIEEIFSEIGFILLFSSLPIFILFKQYLFSVMIYFLLILIFFGFIYLFLRKYKF